MRKTALEAIYALPDDLSSSLVSAVAASLKDPTRHAVGLSVASSHTLLHLGAPSWTLCPVDAKDFMPVLAVYGPVCREVREQAATTLGSMPQDVFGPFAAELVHLFSDVASTKGRIVGKEVQPLLYTT